MEGKFRDNKSANRKHLRHAEINQCAADGFAGKPLKTCAAVGTGGIHLEQAIKHMPLLTHWTAQAQTNPQFMYVVPDFHNPIVPTASTSTTIYVNGKILRKITANIELYL